MKELQQTVQQNSITTHNGSDNNNNNNNNLQLIQKNGHQVNGNNINNNNNNGLTKCTCNIKGKQLYGGVNNDYYNSLEVSQKLQLQDLNQT